MQSLIKFENNHVSFDFQNKPGQKIKIVGTYDEPYFCGKDVCATAFGGGRAAASPAGAGHFVASRI